MISVKVCVIWKALYFILNLICVKSLKVANIRFVNFWTNVAKTYGGRFN